MCCGHLGDGAPSKVVDPDDADWKNPGGLEGRSGGKGQASPSPQATPVITIDDSMKDDPRGPAACTEASIVFIPRMQATCPKNYAAFAADDADNPKFSCCPLPWGDMLDHSVAPVSRGSTCSSREVITGLNGPQVLCSKINAAKHTAAAAKPTC